MKRSTAFIATCLSFIMASCTNTSEGSFVDGVADALINDGKVNIELLEWTREPQNFNVNGDTLIRQITYPTRTLTGSIV